MAVDLAPLSSTPQIGRFVIFFRLEPDLSQMIGDIDWSIFACRTESFERGSVERRGGSVEEEGTSRGAH
jgi:hypothetical protein